MEQLKLNETPVRTSRNFNINNIKIKDAILSKKIGNFKNIKISGENKIDSNISDYNLKYGVGTELINQVKNCANNKIRLIIDNKKDEEVTYEFDKENLNLVEDLEFIANEGSKANIILKYKSNEDIEAYHNGIIRVLAKENSYINITIVNLLSSNSNNFITIDNEVAKNAKVNYCIIDFGGKYSITNYYSNLIRKIC